MKNLFIYLFSSFIIVLNVSCSAFDTVGPSDFNHAGNLNTKSVKHIKENDYKISEKAASLFLNDYGPSDTKWSATPFVSSGDTLFYIFNSDTGVGWKIISGDSRTSPILAENPIGTLDLSKPLSTPIQITLGVIHDRFRSLKESFYEQPSHSCFWEPYKSLAGDLFIQKQLSRDSDAHWVKVLVSTSNTTSTVETVNHLIPTTWDQDSVWNQKTPITSNKHCKVGCVAVAFGQMMYYFHQEYGYPTALYENVSLQNPNTTPLLNQIVLNSPNSSSTRWNFMSLNRNDSGNFSYVEDLLAYIGKTVYMNYGLNASAALPSVSNLEYFGLTGDYVSAQYNTTQNALNNLRNNKPLFVIAKNSSNTRHIWIIDGFIHKQLFSSTTYRYYYVEDPSSLSGSYNGYSIVGLYTDDEMASMHPGYTNGMQIVENSTIDDYSFLMNWGENNGICDSIQQNIYNWVFYLNNAPIYYNYDKYFIYNIHQKTE